MPPKKDAVEEHKCARFGRVRNNLKMGIVGLPNVGKSSLFNLLTEQAISAENYPFCTIDPNEGRCPVPDERYDWLCNLWNPPSKYPAFLHIVDIAGLVKGAAEGAGLGNAFLSHIAAVDGIFHVVRAFDNDDIVHVDDSVDPIRDLETIQAELCKKDMEFVLKAEADEIKDVKKNPQMKLSALFYSTYEKVKALLNDNKPIRDGEWSNGEVEFIKDHMGNLITTKPVIYLVNMSAGDYARKKNKWLPKIHQWVQSHGGGVMIPFSVEWEAKLWSLREDPDGQQAFLDQEPKCSTALPKMIVQGYKELDLIYYFTAGETEVRCWTILKGTLAPQAAGVIHTDFERGFIKAEVVAYADFKALTTSKSMAEVKAAGKYRQEGKTYVVQDGDIIHFQFNVTAAKKK
uniref:Obg-like ATPase 1 n=1 Tax=Chlamydomonas chlamydogama TaxID=225041 RepID=A0A7S2QU02_9CHLO